jgi:peptide/nickel transport system permease protein
VSGFIGVTLGLLAGFYGGKLDAVISRIVDTALAIPFILLAMALIAILGASLQNIVLAIALRTWIVYTRVVRGEVLALKEHEFITGARAMGCRTLRILVVYLLPNVLSSAIVVATLYLGRMIIIEASLSFLGVGVPPPTPTWGGMLSDGRAFLDTAWWIAFFPGIVLMLTVLGVNLLGDWLRDVLDPRMKRLAE